MKALREMSKRQTKINAWVDYYKTFTRYSSMNLCKPVYTFNL